MDNLTIGWLGIAGTLGLIAVGMPIGAALGLVSFFGITVLLTTKAALGMLATVPYSFVGDWNLSAVPMFLLMGYVASNTGLSRGLFHACRLLLTRLPGGLAIASVGACALLAAASGSSLATSAAMARIATPNMLRYNYDRGLASAVIASSGTLGSLIPPSILLILYGYFSGTSVAALFIGGVIPGLVTALLYSQMIVVRVLLKPALAPPIEVSPTRAEILEAVRNVWPLPVLICGVLLGIFFGILTPTEAGAGGATLATVIAWTRRSLTKERFLEAAFQTLAGTASVFMIVIGTVLFMRFMALSTIPTFVTNLFISETTHPAQIIVIVALLYIILGMFMDSIGLLLLTLPIILPIVEAADMDLVWFGIIVVKLLEIGMVTPPVGLNVYVINSALAGTVPLKEIFVGVTWFIVMDIIALALFFVFPDLILWLPSIAS